MVGDRIPCGVCGKLYKVISCSHLRYKHGMEMSEYKSLFPGAPIESAVAKAVNDAHRKSIANTSKNLVVRSKISKANKGKKRSLEFCQKRSEKYKGEGNPFFDKTHSFKTRKRLSAHFQGVPEEEWRGFSGDEHKRAWKSKRAKCWSREIFERDNFTCALCGKRGGDLEAHHITRRIDAPEQTYALGNGITLCVACHKKTFGREAHYEEGFRDMLNIESSKPLK